MNDWKSLLIPYKQAVEELKIKFKSIRDEYRILDEYSSIEFVTGRVKKISSIIDKARLRNIHLDRIEEEIEDIAGIRIMCQFVEDIYSVVALLKKRSDIEIVYERDYVTYPKESGYRSYHLHGYYNLETIEGTRKVLFEVQIRTMTMNVWATVEHSLNYKYEDEIPEEIKDKLLKAAYAAESLDEQISHIRNEIREAQQQFILKRLSQFTGYHDDNI